MNNNKFKLGILFNFNPSWMGGIIYVINLVRALNELEDRDKPKVYLFYSPELEQFLDEFRYPYLTLISHKFPSLVPGFLRSWFSGKNIFVDDIVKQYSLNAVYPVKNYPVRSSTNAKIVAWYADLQHKYYPEFFSTKTLIHRAIRLYFMLRNTDVLVVSSKSVKDDFYRFFNIRKEMRIHIYHFVSINDDFQDLSIEDLKVKYQLPEEYYMVSNQFHKHKNHRVLLLALAELKKKGIKKHLAITGRFPDELASPYITDLHSIIVDNELQDQISMLGIIPRKDQMQLMNHSQAVIQPSLFEGWSTVIEDAISLQVPVIASRLPVNIEQLGNNGVYFDPLDFEELASILNKYPTRDFSHNPYGDYSCRIKESVKKLVFAINGNN